jgi:hypothetical protein
VVGKAEYLAKGETPRFVVTDLSMDEVDARTVYEDLYCAHGTATRFGAVQGAECTVADIKQNLSCDRRQSCGNFTPQNLSGEICGLAVVHLAVDHFAMS